MKLLRDSDPFPASVCLLLELGEWFSDGGETSWPECEKYVATSREQFVDGCWRLDNDGLVTNLHFLARKYLSTGEYQAVFAPVPG
jgi:hypothetical protein